MSIRITIGLLVVLTTSLAAPEPARAADARTQVSGGVVITQVYNGWPAARARTLRGLPARLQEGDRIVAVNGNPIYTTEDLQAELQRSRGTVQLDVIDVNTNRMLPLWVRPVIDGYGVKKIGVEAETIVPPRPPSFDPPK